MCGPKFCSMKISQDIRADAERLAGMEAKKSEFAQRGKTLYVPAAE
jgi:phosphomethylpyrimidine synthase